MEGSICKLHGIVNCGSCFSEKQKVPSKQAYVPPNRRGQQSQSQGERRQLKDLPSKEGSKKTPAKKEEKKEKICRCCKVAELRKFDEEDSVNAGTRMRGVMCGKKDGTMVIQAVNEKAVDVRIQGFALRMAYAEGALRRESKVCVRERRDGLKVMVYRYGERVSVRLEDRATLPCALLDTLLLCFGGRLPSLPPAHQVRLSVLSAL